MSTFRKWTCLYFSLIATRNGSRAWHGPHLSPFSRRHRLCSLLRGRGKEEGDERVPGAGDGFRHVLVRTRFV